MRFERLNSKNNKMYETASELYRISFPSHEQREEASQANILRDKEYHFTLIYDDDIFVGLVLYWEAQGFIYVEHFCILPEMRNRKYGQKALRLLGEKHKTVILEIDPPVDEMSIRRKGFYERCGFADNPYPHVHPPYHRGSVGHDLVIMSSPNRLTEDEYGIFKNYLDCHVMENVYS